MATYNEKEYAHDGMGGTAHHIETAGSDHSVVSSDVWPDSDPRMKKLRRKVDMRICLSLGKDIFFCVLRSIS